MISTNNPPMVACDACGTPTAVFGTIKLGTYDPTRRYKTSTRKMIMNYRWKLCVKHYEEALKTIKSAIEKVG